MKILRSLSRTLYLFGLFGWIYIALNAEFHPWTLSLPLTHFLPFPREDTFGVICFIVSMISYFSWSLIKEDK